MPYSITEICKGCGACVKLCPVGAISGEKKQRHVIDAGKCLSCGVCGRICPNEGAVLNAQGQPSERMKRSEWPKPVVISSICSSCGICVDTCPFKCLEISEPVDFPHDLTCSAMLKDDKGCVGCNLCAEACPQEAIYLARPAA
ncbi:MAG: 4Fe-4S binding protein [Syntrophaceae bacterium]